MRYFAATHFRLVGLALAVCVFSAQNLLCQKTDPDWQRVITGEDSVVDVETSSLRFETGRILSATFRTVLAKPERLEVLSLIKYKTRIETVSFKITDDTYRSSDISLLDKKGKVVKSSAPSSLHVWRPIGPSAATWLAALRTLPPMGEWIVSSYTLLDDVPGFDTSREERLVGSRISFGLNFATVGGRRCSSTSYESRKLSADDLENLLGSSSLRRLGLEVGAVDVVALKCESSDWQPPRSLLIQKTPDQMLMLWNGVFLELSSTRTKRSTNPVVIR